MTMPAGAPRNPVVVEIELDGDILESRPLEPARAEALWNQQHALGRAVRIAPHAFGERPPWVRDGTLRRVDVGVEYERPDGSRYVIGAGGEPEETQPPRAAVTDCAQQTMTTGGTT